MAEKKSVHSGHRSRLKEEMILSGFEGIQEHKLLEALLFYSIPRKDTNELAHTLCDEFGSLRRALASNYEDIAEVEGIGDNTAFLLKLVDAISKHVVDIESEEIKRIGSLTDAYKVFYPLFINQANEKTYAIFLDGSSNIVSLRKLSEGTVNSSSLNRRMIAETAMKKNASGIIIAHNHPFGVPNPSAEDIKSTKALNYFLEQISVHFIDHLIFADDKYISLRQSGIFKETGDDKKLSDYLKGENR